ncbi:killer cell lectin-like receptor subfamily G member 1 [Physeter macrocephalus]|uniref:Killer cell lectin-like receptor subfamily G member 1 n=1 Tax=Physeter macrocephalus TaxID=9755 RepID=A0A455BE89_PHYMC|nr:killer cell lectin-like receptor subfamily G member 1 [Physeter catodon]|eukprot:XP_028347290.1 killer cell lectin-like receptor subfamily G member 1 [Physeter catodon]
MTDNVIYSVLEFSTASQAQNDYRLQQKASSSRSPLSYYVAVALGLLCAILVTLLLFQWILCRGCKFSTCASCPSCPDLWVRYGDHCYYFSVEEKNWNSSLEFCLARDAHLLMFKDNQEMANFLVSYRIFSNSLVQKCGTISKSGLQASSCEVALPWVCKKVKH